MQKPHYGIDAPGLVRFFFMAGFVALMLAFAALYFSFFGPNLQKILAAIFGLVAIYLLGMGSFMIYGSKVMKIKDSHKLLGLVQWSGNEQVLDIGCGRGLMLISAAKHLTSGKATGIDLWQQQDQADNSSSAALSNAVMEDVADRIEVQTADMRKLPFQEASLM